MTYSDEKQTEAQVPLLEHKLEDQQPTAVKRSWFKRVACISLVVLTTLICALFFRSSTVIGVDTEVYPLFDIPDDSPYSALACMDLTEVPKFKAWTVRDKGDSSLEQMAWDVYVTVRDAWLAKDQSTKILFLQDILAVRVTESNASEIEDPIEHVHTSEAIMQIIMNLGDNVPDAGCLYGHEENGHRFAFVYGYDGNKVEATECGVGPDDGFCRFVDTSFYQKFSDMRND